MILFYQWNAFMQKGMENALKKLRIEYEVYYDVADNWDNDDAFAGRFASRLEKERYSCVLSVNYMPIISDICEKSGIKYISWVYDSPLHIRRLDAMKNSCNKIYFFDRVQAEEFRKQGVEGAEYLPLAADSDVFSDSYSDENKYLCDVSLLGQLYKSEYSDLCGGLSMYNRGYLEGIIGAQNQISGGFIIDEMLSDELMANINHDFSKAGDGTFNASKRELSYTLAKEVTGRQRFTALALLQDRCSVNVYSKDVDKRLEKVNFCGYADYYTQMPAIFRKSRINLNISLCTIQTGIPLRILDIMACGGFVITNAQPELFEYFDVGSDLVVYDDMKDMVMKVMYYLKHEEERIRIAENGYRKVREKFSFEDRIKTMLEI